MHVCPRPVPRLKHCRANLLPGLPGDQAHRIPTVLFCGACRYRCHQFYAACVPSWWVSPHLSIGPAHNSSCCHTDLLDILSKGSNPQLILRHLPKNFDNMHNLSFRLDERGEPTKAATGMYSGEVCRLFTCLAVRSLRTIAAFAGQRLRLVDAEQAHACTHTMPPTLRTSGRVRRVCGRLPVRRSRGDVAAECGGLHESSAGIRVQAVSSPVLYKLISSSLQKPAVQVQAFRPAFAVCTKLFACP